MKFAFNLPIFDFLADARVLADLAVTAENAGWDAVLLWDHVNLVIPGMTSGGPHVDPWISLALMADRTTTIRLGTCVTPIPRRRPVKLAREILTLHDLSRGRFIFGAGAGDNESEFERLGEQPELRVRADMLDEGLDVLLQLFKGKDVHHAGQFYQVDVEAIVNEPAVIPIWLAGTWPNRRPFRRAARFDGVFAVKAGFIEPLTPADVQDIHRYIGQHRKIENPFNLAVGANTTGDMKSDRARATALEEAGANWWLDGTSTAMENLDQLKARIERGPPRAHSEAS